MNPGRGISSLDWWLLGSDLVLLGAGEGARAGWRLLGRGMRRCLPEMFGFVLGSRKGPQCLLLLPPMAVLGCYGMEGN